MLVIYSSCTNTIIVTPCGWACLPCFEIKLVDPKLCVCCYVVYQTRN